MRNVLKQTKRRAIKPARPPDDNAGWSSRPDEAMVPDLVVRKVFLGGISDMQLWRYDHDPAYRELNFPRPRFIKTRRFRVLGELRTWLRNRATEPPPAPAKPRGWQQGVKAPEPKPAAKLKRAPRLVAGPTPPPRPRSNAKSNVLENNRR
jgi:hypothetical protein